MGNSENKVLLVDETKSDDELSLLDLLKIIRHHSAVLLGGTLIGGALGLAVAFALPAEWEATVPLQIGQLGGSPVEPPLRVVTRVMQKSFMDQTLKRMKVLPGAVNPNTSLLRNSLKVRIEKTDLVGVRVRGTTPDEATHFTNALIAELESVHVKMARPTIQRWHDEIEKIDAELERLSGETKRLSSLLKILEKEHSAINLFQAILASNVLLARETELNKFLERKNALRLEISPERTFPTSPLGQVEVSAQPVFPNKPIFTAGGLVIGLLMAVLLSLWRSYVFVDKKR